tara:strand:+ start:130 stop:2079 length:1950 start_codon:yes stop_codon:yes gene_type:complete
MKKLLFVLCLGLAGFTYSQKCINLYVKSHFEGDPICRLSNGDVVEICESYKTINAGSFTFYIKKVITRNGNFIYELALDDVYYAAKVGELQINPRTKRFGFQINNNIGSYTYVNENDKKVNNKKPKNNNCISGDCENGQGTITYKSGAKYIGKFKYGEQHGQGTITYKGGGKYQGEFKDGYKDGQGTYTWANGNKYVGEWKKSRKHGQGTFTWANGNKLVGEWMGYRRNTIGTFTWVNGDEYVGEFESDSYIREGPGTFTWADGKREYSIGNETYSDGKEYTGSFLSAPTCGISTSKVANYNYVQIASTNALRKVLYGKGKLTTSNGVVYEGEWSHVKIYREGAEGGFMEEKHYLKNGRNGPNSFKYPGPSRLISGTKYKGNLQNSRKHGQGVLTTLDGRTLYNGEWKDDKMHGQGIKNWVNGDKYQGEWKDDKMHGQGTKTYTSGSKYVGEWKDSRYNGQGTLTCVNGDKYVGEWMGGKPNGEGTLVGNYTGDTAYHGRVWTTIPSEHTQTHSNIGKYVGECKDGKPNGQGTFTCVSGDKYVGEYKDGKPNGQGIITWENGTNYEGKWMDGYPNGYGRYTNIKGKTKEGEFANGLFKGKKQLFTFNFKDFHYGIIRYWSYESRKWLESDIEDGFDIFNSDDTESSGIK